MEKILIINPGSTSTKYKVFDLKGNVLDEQNFKLSDKKKEEKFLKGLENIKKIGIRVVHGGDISETSKITKKIKGKIKEYIDFAPIHNLIAIETIDKIERIFLKTPLFACFDTAFHATVSEHLSTYAIPTKLAKKHKIKKYGFHGLAIQSALKKVIEITKNHRLKFIKKIIFIHLGGGCSITAVKNRKSFCTSMGLTPISGIMMTTRPGDIDSDLDKILSHKENKSIDEISDILNFESGFLGMTGSKDTLKIFNKAKDGGKKEKLAFDIFVSDITKKVFAYTGLMQGVDAVVFSGGIGYGNKYLRDTVTRKLKILGIEKKDIYSIDVDEEEVIFNELKKIKK